MWAVDRPTVSAEEMIRGGARRVRDRGLARRLISAVPALAMNEAALEELVSTQRLYEACAEDFELDDVSDDELRWFYTRQIADARGGSRKQYDQILAAARFGLCSYCQHCQATTLDHVVAKANVGGLAVSALNLVPACQQCNKQLLDWAPGSHAEDLFHPYFESVGSRWLFAEVIEDGPGALRFYADPAVDLEAGLRERVIHQFQRLALGEMFSVVSARELAEAREIVRGPDVSGTALPDIRRRAHRDASSVAAIFVEESQRSLNVDQNSRRGAVFEALAASEWFCEQIVTDRGDAPL